jgi:mRNA interferase RelE/StbE
VDINSAVGRKAGLTDEKLLAVVKNDLSVFSDVERLVIELADAMVETPSNVSDDLYARLREKFSEEQLLQLGAQLAFENYRARLNRVFDVAKNIVLGIMSLAENPRPIGSRKLANRSEMRLRIGDYRVLYVVDDVRRTVTISVITHPREVYR